MRLLFFHLFFLLCIGVFANKLDKAFNALSIYNYFEAKKQFENVIKKDPAPAYFGLSTIYSRNDNPFYKIDTAYVYIKKASNAFAILDPAKKEKLKKYNVTRTAIDSLKKIIFEKAFSSYKTSLQSLSYFLDTYIDAPQRSMAIDLRDSIVFAETKSVNTSEFYLNFIENYSQAKQLKDAKALYELTKYKEATANKTLDEYEKFMIENPYSPYMREAENAVFSLMITDGTIEQYQRFIRRFPRNHNVESAWHAIYTLYTADNKPKSIAEFRFKFPDYPYMDNLVTELDMALTKLYRIKQNNKWGFMDVDGRLVIGFVYDWADDFSEGLAAVGLNNKAGFINKLGKIIVPFEYDEVEAFKNGFAVIRKNDKAGFIDKHGNIVVPIAYDDLGDMNEYLAWFKKDNSYGFINHLGKVAIEPVFNSVADFKQNLAAASLQDKWGFIDKKGSYVLKPSYDWVEDYKNSFARVKKGNKYGLTDTAGKEIYPCEYDILDRAESLFLVVKDNKYGFGNKQGQLIVPIEYDYSPMLVKGLFQKGYGKLQKNKKQGIVDKVGTLVVPVEYDEVNYFSEDVASVRKKEKWGYIDLQQKLIINYQYDFAGDFINGLARVKKREKWGVIGKDGKYQIHPEYFDLHNVLTKTDWLFAKKEKWGIVTTKNEVIVDFTHDSLETLDDTLLKLTRNGSVAYYNYISNKIIWKEEGYDLQ